MSRDLDNARGHDLAGGSGMTGPSLKLNYHGRKLLRELTRLRGQSKLTLKEAGERTHIELKKLSRIERRQLPTYHELLILLDAYGIPSCDYGPHVDLLGQAKQRPWWRNFDLQDVRYIRMEDEASRKFEFQLGEIPTLLQTEAYARRTIAKQCKSIVDKKVAFRMRQQERLIREPLLELHALIHESVLGRDVDREQLAKLVELAELPNVTIQIVPQSPANLGLTSSVCLLSFNDPDEPDIVFTDSVIGLQESEDTEQTSKIKRLLRNAARRATNPTQSLMEIHALLRSHR